MLRKIRIGVALLLFATITFAFLDFAGLLPQTVVEWLTKIQFLPALLSLNIAVLAALLLLTLLLGRVYCSVICPLGVFQDVVDFIACKIHKKRKRGYRKNLPWLRWGVLALLVATFVFGFTFLLGLVAPYSMYGRMAVNLFQPLYMLINNALADLLIRYDNYTFFEVDVVMRSVAAFVVALSSLLIVVVLAYRWGRTYCNTICPVGTLLGYLSKFSWLKIRIDTDKCNHCGLCGKKCKAYCIDSPNQKIDYTRCVSCFNCIGTCKQGAIYYGKAKKEEVKTVDEGSVDSSRRQFLKSGAATAVVLPLALSGRAGELLPDELKPAPAPQHPVTPPGSRGVWHLSAHCTTCHLCISKCPSQVIKPALLQYGLGGMMQPILSYAHGYCDAACTVCGEVCPTGAIHPLTAELRKQTHVGVAVYHLDQCVIELEEDSCGRCSRACPVGAIAMVADANGVEHPQVDADSCIGCGACEYYCPAKPKAIVVEGYERHTVTE